jgi:ATP-binding cassette subfamily C protein
MVLRFSGKLRLMSATDFESSIAGTGVPVTRARKLAALFDRAERAKLAVLLALMAIAAILEMAGVALVPLFLLTLQQPGVIRGHVLVAAVMPGASGLDDRATIYAVSCAVLAFFVFKNLFSWFVLRQQYRFMHGKMHQLSTRLLAAYLAKPYTFHLQRNSSELYRNVMNECTTVVSMVLLPATALVVDGLTVLCVSALLIYHQPSLTLLAVAVFGAATLILYLAVRRRAGRFGAHHQTHGRLSSLWLNQSLGGVKEAMVAGTEASFVERFSEHWRQSTDAQAGYLLLSQMPRFFNETLAIFAILVLANIMLVQGRGTDEIILTLALFGAATFRLVPTLSRMVSSFTALRFALPSVDALYADLGGAQAAPLQRRTRRAAPRPDFDRILIENLSYRYPGAAREALKNVHLEIPRNSAVGIVGPSGAGKTTLADVLLGLLKPDGGRIVVGAVDVHADSGAWQQRIGYIPQSIFLLDDSIRRNIAFGVPDAEIDEEAIRRAVRIARLDEFLATLPSGLDTTVGERGVRLSGGQRQRIGIARALYHRPDVLLLDEATSALDNQTETEVAAESRTLSGEVTILVIAHRLSTVKRCERLVFLRDGELVAYAPFDELMRAVPGFRDLVNAGLK